MATLTASLAASSRYPKAVHVGANQVTAKYVTEATVTGSDSILMLRVPDGAVIHDMVLSTGTNLDAGGAGAALAVGDQSSAGRYISTATTTATARVARIDQAGGVGWKYEFSDDVSERDRNDKIVVEVDGTLSSSVTITLSVLYAVDQ